MKTERRVRVLEKLAELTGYKEHVKERLMHPWRYNTKTGPEARMVRAAGRAVMNAPKTLPGALKGAMNQIRNPPAAKPPPQRKTTGVLGPANKVMLQGRKGATAAR